MAHNILDGLVIISLTVLLLALLLKRFKQPYFVAYIIAGVLLGPEVSGVVHKTSIIEQMGELGVILLMFFIGAEINPSDLSKNFKKPWLGTLSQLLLSFSCMTIIGYFLDWAWPITILMTFVISLNSSAIIFQYLSKTGELHSKLGLLTSGVLIVQDILVVPMILSLNFMAEGELQNREVIKTIVGGILILLFLRAAISKNLFKIPLNKELTKEHDLQVFVGLLLCFGLAWVTNWLGLSAALGAFVSGIVVGQDKSTQWLGHALVPFRIFFLSVFFLSIGLQIQLDFVINNFGAIMLITLCVLLINSLINTLIFRWMGSTWRDSVYSGALLSQIGEFSFVLVNMAVSIGLIVEYSYQITLAVIAMTMMLTMIWISVIQKFIYKLPDKLLVS